MANPGWTRRLAGYLWGYDFFVSYHWASGGRYAVALAEALRTRGHECFLDRSEFAAGDDWRVEARLALRRTQRLLVVATPEAVSASDAVAHELEEFQARRRPVILVVFGHRFAAAERDVYPALQLIPGDSLDVVEPADVATGAPSPATVDEIVRSYRVLRRRALRARWIAGVIATLTVLLVVSALQTARARSERDEAERQRRQSEHEAAGQAGQVLVLQARDGNDEDLLPAAVDLAERAMASPLPVPPSVTQAMAAAVSRPAYRLAVLRGPGPQALAAHFAGERRLVTNSLAAAPELWDAETGRLLAALGRAPADVAASADGRRALTFGLSATDVWDTEAGAHVVAIAAGDVEAAWFAPDGRHVVLLRKRSLELRSTDDGRLVIEAARDDATRWSDTGRGHLAIATAGQLVVWDLVAATATAAIPLGGAPGLIVLSPRARYAAVLRGASCEVWDLTARSRVGGFDVLDPEGRLAFTGDESLVVSPHDGKLRVHATATGALVAEVAESMSTATASPDGVHVLTTESLGPMRLRDPRTMRVVLTAPDPTSRPGVFSRDGRWLLAVGSDHVARIWDVTTQRLVTSLRGSDLLLRAAMSPDGSRVAIASFDGTIELWALTEGRRLAADTGAATRAGIDRAVFDASGAHVITAASDGAVSVFEVATGRRVATFAVTRAGKALADTTITRSPLELEVAPGGGRLLAFAAFGAGVDLWTVAAGAHVAIDRQGVLSARFDAAGARLVTGSATGEVEVWDAGTGARLHAFDHGDLAGDAAFSPDGRWLASVGDDVVKLWDLERPTGAPLVAPHGDVARIAFSPDGAQLLSEGDDGDLALWQVAAIAAYVPDPWRPVRPLARATSAYRATGAAMGKADTTLATAFAPQGPRALITGYDRRLRLWDVTGTAVELQGFLPETMHAAIAVDGTRVVAASADGIARLWASDGQLLAAFGGHAGAVNAASLSADGTLLVTAGADGTARIYPATLAGLVREGCERLRHDRSAPARCRR